MVEIHHRVRGGANRQGRGKRRRRTEAGLEPRDEAALEPGGESRKGKELSGSGLLELGAPKGRTTPREDGCEKGETVVRDPGIAYREAGVVLEGERKAMSGT